MMGSSEYTDDVKNRPQRMEKNDKLARTKKPSKDPAVVPAKDLPKIKSERA